jgi:hypothetical protein
MPRKITRRKKPVRQVGKGFFGKVFKTLKRVIPKVNKLLKDTKLISKVALATNNPAVSGYAGAVGYGKKKPIRRRPPLRRVAYRKAYM